MLAISTAAVAALFIGCGNSAPEIAAVEWRLEARPDAQGKSYESLSAFASLKHGDGIDSIDTLWIVNDASGLAWKLDPDGWEKTIEGSDTWIGGSDLATQDFAALPRGEYRFVATDIAGQKTEKSFKVSGSFPGWGPPSISISDRRLSIGSSWPETLAVAYDGVGDLIASTAAPRQPSGLEDNFGADVGSRVAEVAAYGYAPELHMGSFSKRVRAK